MNHLSGKKLLIIGSDASNISAVDVARDMGIYTIVVDSITDRTKTPTKNVADEAWDIDYSDVEALASKCKEADVDGVFAGYSEYRVMAACKIANRLGLPFYATEEQINITRNKRTSKDLCQKYDIPTPKDYCYAYPISDEEKKKIEYPVIVKPVDYGGRKGISICTSTDELDAAIENALCKSQLKNVIVEDYIEGMEFSSVYTIANGKISLSAVNEKYITNDQKIKTGLCEFLISPASFYHRYVEELDGKMREFIKGIKAMNGVMFFQGIVTDEKIYVFEMGYRINGNNDFYVIEKYNGLNFMKMMLSYSLCGDMCDDLSHDNPLYPQYACTLLFNAHGGVIGTLEYDELLKHENIMDVTVERQLGEEILEDGSTSQCVLKMKLFADTLEEVVKIVEYAQDYVVVKNVEGNNMLFKPFDAKILIK